MTCRYTKYTCVLVGDNKWTINVTNPLLCRVDRDLNQQEYDCNEASVSGTVSSVIDFTPATAHGIGQLYVIGLIALGVIMVYCGFFIGAYIYRK
jgi:hypothetical protein